MCIPMWVCICLYVSAYVFVFVYVCISVFVPLCVYQVKVSNLRERESTYYIEQVTLLFWFHVHFPVTEDINAYL